MSNSQWHKFYGATVGASPETLFTLLADLPRYSEWLPGSQAFEKTSDVEPYPVRLGSRYHDGKPGKAGSSWWGTVTGFQPPGSIDFHHTIAVRPLRAAVDVHIHYCFEPEDGDGRRTRLTRWLVLDVAMPIALRPLRRFIISAFDAENVRTMTAAKRYAEARADMVGS